MIKMYIDNEEVVCNKEFTIKEEMLSTSSTILNNCYPKSWEQDHDYVSRFYYPKDYSKCLIKDVTDIPTEEGEYATGTNLNINVDNTKEWSYQLEGDTQQNTIILPSGYTQVDYIQSSGTQYINTTYVPTNNTKWVLNAQFNQLTTQFNGRFDNTVTPSGQRCDIAISSGYFYINGGNNTQTITADTNVHTFVLDMKNGIASIDDSNFNLSTQTFSSTRPVYLFARRANTIEYYCNENIYGCKFYENDVLTMNLIPCYRNSDNEVGLYDLINDVFYTNQGTGEFTYGKEINLPTPYYPQDINVVTGEQNVEIVGKNLFDKNSENVLSAYYEYSGDTIKSSSGNKLIFISCKSNTSYTITQGTSSLSNHIFQIATTNETPTIGTTVYNFVEVRNQTNYTYTTNSSAKYLLLRLRNNDYNDTNYMSTIQFEVGTAATEYQPYQSQNYTINLGNIELCKTENYQDYIYNQNGEWYLHKETGIYYINTSQITLKSSYTNVEYASIPKASDYVGYGGYGHNFVYCNKAISGEPIGGWDNSDNINKIFSGAEIYNWWIGFEKGTGLSGIKEVLKNLVIIYPLATPTDTKITDTNLIQQLDNLKNATLFKGINNISVDGNLSAILNLHYNFVTARIDEELLFSGMVKNSGDISLNPRYPKYCSLEILDFKDFLSTGDMLDFVISNKTITEAINMVVEKVSQYGFILGNVNILNPDEVIGAYSTENKSAYDVFQYLADISQSRWTTRMINENTIAIDFYDPTLMPSGIDIDYTNEWWCNNKVIDLSFNYGTRDYRNKQIMLSDEIYGGVDYDETIIADGYNTNYLTTSNIAEVKAISVNGVQMTVATTYEKELGVEADFYYTFGNNTIETNETYLAGTVIDIGYTPLVRGREVVANEDEINRVSGNTGRKGVIARYENRNDVLSSNELKMIGETYIKYKGTAEIIINLSSEADLYNIGQSVYFNAPIDELNTNYMVKKKSIQYLANINKIFYTYELSSSFNSEAAINWFDNQRNKVTGNISEGESITRNIDLESKATIIFSNATATEITITDDNVLNAPLNAPFTN